MKRFLFTVLLLTVAAAALSGCKKDGTKDGKNGGAVVVGITQDLDSLDPHKAVAAGTKEVLYNLFEGLVKSDPAGNLVPAVAESYRISDDGKTYTFVLRSDVTFHNGKKLTAEDVVYSLKRVAGKLTTSDPEVQVLAAFSVAFIAVFLQNQNKPDAQSEHQEAQNSDDGKCDDLLFYGFFHNSTPLMSDEERRNESGPSYITTRYIGLYHSSGRYCKGTVKSSRDCQYFLNRIL